MRRAVSRSAGVSTPNGTVSTTRDVDPHAGLQRAQLLQPLPPLQRRGRQRDEALQRRAAIGIEPDMVLQRPVAGRRGGAGEIERAQRAGRDRRSRRPSRRSGWCALPRRGSRRPAWRYRPRGRPAAEHGADVVRVQGREIALQLTTMSASPVRVELLQRRVDPVRAGRVVGRSSPRGRRRASPRRRSRRVSVATTTPADPAASRPAQHLHDHRHAAISASGLPGRRVEAMRAGISTKVGFCSSGEVARKTQANWWVLANTSALYGLPDTGKPMCRPFSGCAAKACFRGFPTGRATRPTSTFRPGA